MFSNFRSDEAGGEEPFEDEQYIYYDDEVDFEDARSREVDRLDTAETSYAKNRLRDEPHLAKAAKARLQSAASAAKGKYGSGGNRDAIQFCRELHVVDFQFSEVSPKRKCVSNDQKFCTLERSKL